MSGWQAVVFDLDDTLYPERCYVRSGMQAVAAWAERQWGFPAPQTCEELWHAFESGARHDSFDRWLERRGLSPARWTETMVSTYRQHQPRIEPFPGAPALLERIGARSVLGLVSDGPVIVQRRKLEALGLAR